MVRRMCPPPDRWASNPLSGRPSTVRMPINVMHVTDQRTPVLYVQKNQPYNRCAESSNCLSNAKAMRKNSVPSDRRCVCVIDVSN